MTLPISCNTMNTFTRGLITSCWQEIYLEKMVEGQQRKFLGYLFKEWTSKKNRKIVKYCTGHQLISFKTQDPVDTLNN